MKHPLIAAVEKKQIAATGALTQKQSKAEAPLTRVMPKFEIGDSVDVVFWLEIGDKGRTQTFSGVVIAKKHSGLAETFTVRKIVQNEGVERIFPVHSPRIMKLEIKRMGRVRRAKLYYLRDRVGKATRLRERKPKVSGRAGAFQK